MINSALLSKELAAKIYDLLKIKGRDMYYQVYDYATGVVNTTFIYIDEEHMREHIKKMTEKEGFYYNGDEQSERMHLYYDLFKPEDNMIVYKAVFKSRTISMFED